MLFNSFEFLLLYLPIVWLGFYLLNQMKKDHLARVFLLISSLFFYAYWDYRLLPLLLGSILFNYFIGSSLIKNKSKGILYFGVGLNLSLLFFFKYFSFVLTSLAALFSFPAPNITIILPLGISFFTFTQIAFLVDAYKSQAEKTDLYSYGLFVTIFPHLIAGPILHHKEMIQQFKSDKMFRLNLSNLQMGIAIFVIGLCKKTLIADHLSHMVYPIFDHPTIELTLGNTWFATLAYTLQLYFDFSGYSDMAIGLGKMFNVELPINFDSPYKSTSIIEFWKKWHITLSQFLRNYLYIPLGGNRFGKMQQMKNLFLTMFLGGIWHGAGFTFIIWGALHGVYLIINHSFRSIGGKCPQILGWALTFFSISIAWIFFRADSVDKALRIIHAMIGHTYSGEEKFFPSVFQLISFVPILFATFFLPNSREWAERIGTRTKWAIGLGIGLSLSLISFDKSTEFLYFQF